MTVAPTKLHMCDTSKAEVRRKLELILEILGKGEGNRHSVAAQIGLSTHRTSLYLEQLHRTGQTHIVRWEKQHNGFRQPFYVSGRGLDAPKPELVENIRLKEIVAKAAAKKAHRKIVEQALDDKSFEEKLFKRKPQKPFIPHCDWAAAWIRPKKQEIETEE